MLHILVNFFCFIMQNYLSANTLFCQKGWGWWLFLEGDLLYDVETFRSYPFIPRQNFVN